MSDKMTVMLICGYRSVYGGNFIPSLMEIERAVTQKGYNVIYIFPSEADQRHWYHELYRLGKNVAAINFEQSKLAFLKCVDGLVKQHNVALIHAHFAPIILMEMYAAYNRRIKMFIHLHSDFSGGNYSLKQKCKNILVYRFLSKRIRFLSVSRAFVDYNPNRVIWIPNGLSMKRIAVEHQSGAQIRKELQIPEDSIFCELFGWSPRIKGVDIAVEAVKKIRQEDGVDVRLGIVCGREMTTDQMPKWVRQNTSCSETEEYIYYMPPSEDVYAYHEAADILISASRSEGFSYSILEMLNLGKRCVMSDIPGVSWAKEFEGSYVFPSENIDACRESIQKAISRCRIKSEDTISSIQESYSIDKWVTAVVKAYGI